MSHVADVLEAVAGEFQLGDEGVQDLEDDSSPG